MRGDPVDNHEDVRHQEDQEDRHQRQHRLLHASQVQDGHAGDDEDRQVQLVGGPPRRQETEDRVGAAGDGHGDGQHVVDQQGATGDHAQPGRKQLAGHEVPAAARGEQLDDLRVAGGDDENGQDGAQAHEDTEVAVVAEGQKRLGRTVARRRQPIRAQPDPREEGHQRELVEKGSVSGVSRLADDHIFQCVQNIHRGRYCSGPTANPQSCRWSIDTPPGCGNMLSARLAKSTGTPMQTRLLGNTDLKLTTVGLGTWAMGGPWQFGWGPQDDAEAIAAIHEGPRPRCQLDRHRADLRPGPLRRVGRTGAAADVPQALYRHQVRPAAGTTSGRDWPAWTRRASAGSATTASGGWAST